MACEEPIEAYRAATGGPVSFTRPRDGHYWTKIQIPCGTCILCRGEQARQWAVRITHEATQHDQNCFITLTYSDNHLPEHNSLRVSDLQKFFKRLRKKVGQIRYYAVGEYGDQTQRPHYHACIFGHAFAENRIIIKDKPYLLWTSPLLHDTWGMGHVSVGALTYHTAAYTASYVTKKLARKQQYVRVEPSSGELIPLEQPRAYMSRRPGIGSDWYQKHGDYTYAHDHVIANGSPAKPPKYYDRKLQEEDLTLYETIKANRQRAITPQSPEQLRARARNAHARARQRTKSV